MRISTAFTLMLLLKPSLGYQINQDKNNMFKQAIEKSTKKKVDEPTSSAPTALDDGPPNYWFNSKMHTFGNTGLFGGFHAFMAPLATKMIDSFAYDGEDVRSQISRELRDIVGKKSARVLDLCCGVGMSTRALQTAFQDAEAVIGVDTSPEMIAMAQACSDPHSVASKIMALVEKAFQQVRTSQRVVAHNAKACACAVQYALGNAERTFLPEGSFDLVTIMYGFHEVPYHGRNRILDEVRRLLSHGGTLAVIDISPAYSPSPTMLAGEPYVLEYQANIQTQLRAVGGFANTLYSEIVPGHVGMWLLTRDKANTSKPMTQTEVTTPVLPKLDY